MQHCVSEFTFEFEFGPFDVHELGEDLVFRLNFLVGIILFWYAISDLNFVREAHNLGFRNIIFNLQLGRFGLSGWWIKGIIFYFFFRYFGFLFKIILEQIRIGVRIPTIVVFASLAWRFGQKPKWTASGGRVCRRRPSTKQRAWVWSLENSSLHSLCWNHRWPCNSQKGLRLCVLDLLSLIRRVTWAGVGVCLKSLLVVSLHVRVLVVGV